MKHPIRLLPICLFLAVLCGVLGVYRLIPADVGHGTSQSETQTAGFLECKIPALPNCFAVVEGVYSGGQPKGQEGFAQLAKLGVRTIISVDGMAPNVELADQHGCRYVHIPLGYGKLDPRGSATLAKAISRLERPIYIHCHHGKHRSPAAAAVACIGAGEMKVARGIELLNAAGADPAYSGLFASVESARVISEAELAQTQGEFVSHVPARPMVEAMVELESHLEDVSTSIDKNTAEQIRDERAQSALLLFEAFAELLRDNQRNDEAFESLLKGSKSIAKDLHSNLVAPNRSHQDEFEIRQLVSALRDNCRKCHLQFRGN